MNFLLSNEYKSFLKILRRDLYDLAVVGGEDYSLLITVDQNHYQALLEDYSKQFGRPLFAIGTITSAINQIEFKRDGESRSFKNVFDHFNF